VCWAGSFVIDRLISAGGGLLYIPMETWSVSTGTVDFVVGVDKKLWVGSGLFKNCKSLFSTQGTVFGSESFDYSTLIGLLCRFHYGVTGSSLAAISTLNQLPCD